MKKGKIFFPIVLAVLSAAALITAVKYFYRWYDGSMAADMVWPNAMAAILLLGFGIVLAVATYYAINTDPQGNPIK